MNVRRNASAMRGGGCVAAMRKASCRTLGFASESSGRTSSAQGCLLAASRGPIAAMAASWTRVEEP